MPATPVDDLGLEPISADDDLGLEPIQAAAPGPKPGDINYRDTRPFNERLLDSKLPGSFEGKPENIGEYYPEVGRQVAGGVSDIAEGEFARGGHKVLSGVGMGLAPVAPFMAEWPTLATAVAAGTGGGYAGSKGAEAMGATPDQQDFIGDLAGIVAGGGAPKVPRMARAALPFAKEAAGRVGPLAKTIAREGTGRIPIVRRMERFRQPTWGEYGDAIEHVFERKPVFPKEAQGPRWPSGNMAAEEGEYLDPFMPSAGKQTPFAPSESVQRPQLPERGTVSDLPYRRGPGEVPADPVGPSNPDVLAGNQGVRVKRPNLLPAGMSPWEGPPPPRPKVQNSRDLLDDRIIEDVMRNDLARNEQSVMSEEARDFAARNSADVPKWRRNAESQAQRLLDMAERKSQRPARYTKTKTPKPTLSVMDEVTPPGDDLVPLLEESLRRAQAAKGGR